jgi:tetratricopeptide (TPR) repeat protein
MAIALVALTAVVFAPIRTYGFVPWDDPFYVTRNPNVLAGLTARGVLWAFTTGAEFYWHPLTWLTHMVDVEIYGMDAGGHHVMNLVLHVMSTLLLFATLRQVTGRLGESAFVAGLFAVHPLHVESVAWVAERKDVLSGFFWMLTLWTYVSYVRAPGLRRYLLVVLCFLLGLMAKPMTVTLPFVLLLLDVWPLRRISFGSAGPDGRLDAQWSVAIRLVREKLPLIALGVVCSAVTFLNQLHAGSVRALGDFPLGVRLANAVLSYSTYIANMVWPVGLAAFYPYPRTLPDRLVIVAALLALVAVSVVVTSAVRRRPYLAVGWFWYLGTLLPVIGLVQVGDQARADRFTYIPLIGLFVMVAWGIPDLLARSHRARVALAAAAGVVLLGSAAAARTQVSYWKDGFTLCERAIAVTTGNQRAYASLGQLLESQGRTGEAIANYREASRFMIDASGLHTRIGTLLMQQGKAADAASEFSAALKSQPNNAVAHHNLALALDAQGKASEALEHHTAAVRCDPQSAVGHQSLGAALASQGRTDEAIAEFTQAVRIRPDWALAHNSLALALGGQGRQNEAIREGLEVVRLEPDRAEWHSNLSVLFNQHGDIKKAIEQLEIALGLAPQHSEAPTWHYNLAAMFERTGDDSQVIAHLRAALSLNPHFEAARTALARIEGRR